MNWSKWRKATLSFLADDFVSMMGMAVKLEANFVWEARLARIRYNLCASSFLQSKFVPNRLFKE